MTDRLKSPAAWIGFTIAVLAVFIHGGYVSPAVERLLHGAQEILGVAGAWFFGAGMLPVKPSGLQESAEVAAKEKAP